VQNNQRKEQQGATAVKSHITGLWLTNDFRQGSIGHQRGLCPGFVQATEIILGYLRTLTGPCHGWFGDFWQELTGCQKQLSPNFVQVAEMIGYTRVLLIDLDMTFYQPLVSS
jgi:hypothetical protein